MTDQPEGRLDAGTSPNRTGESGYPQPSAGRGIRRAVRLIHRQVGLICAAFLLVMGVSGIFLTHAHQLGLQPLMIELHTGLFLGPGARLYCDVLGGALAVLALTGLYLYVSPFFDARRRSRD